MPSQPPRIAYLTSEYPTVSHTFILREVEALRDRGLEVLTCSIRKSGPEHHRGPAEKRAAETTFNVIKTAKRPSFLLAALVHALAEPRQLGATLRLAWRTRRPGLKALVWQAFYLVEALVLARHLQVSGVTHLHGHFAQASSTVLMLVSELTSIPFSFTLHGPADFLDPQGWHLGEKIARSRFVACISHFCRSQGMMASDPAFWSRLRIVHCAVDPERYGAFSGRADRGRTGRLLFVGRLVPVKGVSLLLEAFAALQEDYRGARLTLIGDGPERTALEGRAAQLGVAVDFAGYRSQDEVASALADSDLFVLPSFAEGVPVVLMEAMASGLPVVTTRIAGIPELVEDGVSGLVLPPGDPAALGGAIAQLLSDPDLRARMGAAGRARVKADFAIRREAEWLHRLFLNEAPEGALRPG